MTTPGVRVRHLPPRLHNKFRAMRSCHHDQPFFFAHDLRMRVGSVGVLRGLSAVTTELDGVCYQMDTEDGGGFVTVVAGPLDPPLSLPPELEGLAPPPPSVMAFDLETDSLASDHHYAMIIGARDGRR